METRFELNKAQPTAHTLAVMAGMVRNRRADEKIRSTAHAVVSGCAPTDDVCRMRRLLGYVKSSVEFERDPVDVEGLTDPALLLERIAQHGTARGDCDDAAILLSALLESIGVRTRFIALSIRRDGRFHHVAVEGQQKGGGWYLLDPYGPQETGARPVFTAALRAAV